MIILVHVIPPGDVVEFLGPPYWRFDFAMMALTSVGVADLSVGDMAGDDYASACGR